MKDKLNVLRAGDQFGWAYYFISQEHARYSAHNIIYAKHDEVNLKGVDVLYIHSPDITNYHATKLPLMAKEKGIKVIGAYAGNPLYWSPAEKRTYSHADLIVTISPQTYSFAKFHYTNIPVIYMPECVDTNFFNQKKFSYKSFNIGWAGGTAKKIKRFHLTKKLNYPIMTKDNWINQRNSQDRNLTLQEMKEFYHSIDVLIVTSESECQPRVVMEAMAVGIPVIATDVGSMRMLLDDFCIVNSDENLCVQEMNNKLRILKEYPLFKKELGERNRKYIEQYFSWKATKSLWDSMFKNVYNGHLIECQKNSEEFLSQFGNKFTSKLIDFSSIRDIVPMTTEQILFELISIFTQLNVQYCVLQDTCKDIILQKENKSGIINLGCVITEEVKQLLLCHDYKFDNGFIKKQNTAIQLNGVPARTKSWAYKDKKIVVPFPLVEYLRNNYGTPVIEELKKKGLVT